MIEMPSDLDRPWETWTPTIGQRVRIAISPECPYEAGWTHFSFESGLVGEIVNIDDEPGEPGHVYWVQFDQEITNLPERYSSSGVLVGGYYAAIELEPLEANRA